MSCRGPVAMAVRGPEVARPIRRVIQIPGLVGPDDATTARAADLALGYLSSPASA
jgi:hypothetical protein